MRRLQRRGKRIQKGKSTVRKRSKENHTGESWEQMGKSETSRAKQRPEAQRRPRGGSLQHAACAGRDLPAFQDKQLWE